MNHKVKGEKMIAEARHRLAVYGTLKKGYRNHFLFGRDMHCLLTTRVPGAYPGRRRRE